MCGLAETLLRAGSARDFMGTLGPRSVTDLRLEGLYQGTHRSQQQTGTRRTWTTKLLRHRDYGIGRRQSGDSPPAHIGTEPLSRGLRHSTRRAPRPFRGSGPGQRISELMDSEADGSWRTERSDGK